MMRKYFLLILLVHLFVLNVQPQEKKIIIPFKPGDCQSCNVSLNSFLESINHSESEIWLLPENFKGHGELFKEKLKLNIKGKLVFDNLMYKKYTQNYSSSNIFIVDNDSIIRIIPNTSFNIDNALIVKDLLDIPTKKLLFSLPDSIKLTYSTSMHQNGFDYFIHDEIYNDVYKYSINSSNIIRFNQKKLLNHYVYSIISGKKNMYDLVLENRTILEKNGFFRVKITNISVDQDMIYFLCQFPVIFKKGKEIHVTFNDGVVVFNNEFDLLSVIPLKKKEKIVKDGGDYYLNYDFFKVKDDAIYFSYWPDIRKGLKADAQFIAIGKLNNSSIKHLRFLSFTITKDLAILLDNVIPQYIYTNESTLFHYLLPYLFDFNSQQKSFLNFCSNNKEDEIYNRIDDLVDKKKEFDGPLILSATELNNVVSILYQFKGKYHKMLVNKKSNTILNEILISDKLFKDNGGISSRISSTGFEKIIFLEGTSHIVEIDY